MIKKTLLIWFLMIHCAIAAQMITKVIQLNYQQAATIIHLVQPLLADGEQITGSGQTIVVKVMPNTLTQLRVILQKVDQPPVTFQVSIYQGDPNWLNDQNNSDFTISTNSQRQQQRSQSVTVMNGESAFISTGQDQPVISNVGIGWWSAGVSYQRQVVQSGVLVEPTLQGQKVKLSVRRVRQQNNDTNNQSVDMQQVMTTVMVPLNQWVSLGSAQNAQQANDTTQVVSVGNNFTNSATLYIKVSIVGGSNSSGSDQF